jgi:hypothetical protein
MAIRTISAGEDFATIIAALNPGDYAQFLPGIHEGTLDANDALITVDKSLNIEFMSGATLKLADNSTSLGAAEFINNILPAAAGSVSGTYTGSNTAQFWVKVTTNGTPDKFSWAKVSGLNDAEPTYTTTAVNITGSPQLLSDGISITFTSTTGNTLGSGFIISIPCTYHGVRVGTGLQSSYIENVKIFGLGTIDMNWTNNLDPELYSFNLPSAVLFHGRVRKVGVYGLQLKDAHRAVMAYGEHDGTYNAGGSTTGGTSYDAEFVDIISCDVPYMQTSQAGFLLGHPSHRGTLKYVRVMNNILDTDLNSIECNFNLDNYKVINNWVRTRNYAYAIHCWRKSQNGLIAENVQYISAATLVQQSAPSGWDLPSNITVYNNYTL